MHMVQENWEFTCVCTHVLLKAMRFGFICYIRKLSCFLTLAILSVQKYHSAYQPAGHKRIISSWVEIVLTCATLGMGRGAELKCSEYTQLSFYLRLLNGLQPLCWFCFSRIVTTLHFSWRVTTSSSSHLVGMKCIISVN